MKGIKGLELSMSSATTMQSAEAEWSPRRLRAMPNRYLETVVITKKDAQLKIITKFQTPAGAI